MTYQEIKPHIDQGLVSEQVHPEAENLRIFNYTQKCQFSKQWNPVTRACRGLILDVSTGEIVANPFPKFFNYGEVDVKIPAEKPIVIEKMDGSLGILYWIGDRPYVATRGSFVSDQAIWATKWFRENCDSKMFNRDYTFLFEIIYPANRIVVSYDFSGLVLLAIRDRETGKEIMANLGSRTFAYMGARVPKVYDVNDLAGLKDLDEGNAEGFVVFYPECGLRVKVKFPEYVRLHKILTGLSVKGVWEYMRANGPECDILELAKDAPDEFHRWLEATAKHLQDQFYAIEAQASTAFAEAVKDRSLSRKEFAQKFRDFEYPGILFAMLDGKDHQEIIWRMIRPRGEKTFKNDE